MKEETAIILKFDGSEVEPDLCTRVMLEIDQQIGVVRDKRVMVKRVARRWGVQGTFLGNQNI